MRFAKIISVAGHPLLLGMLYVVLMSYHSLPKETAFSVSFAVMALITIPIILNNWRKTKKGIYTNFDVSDQMQRRGFYPFAIFLFMVLLFVFWVFDFPQAVINNSIVFFAMVLLMAMINLKIKASMHAGLAFYIAVSVINVGLAFSAVLFAFALAISWSRVKIKRHSFREVVIGMLIGIAFGWLSLII